MRVLLAHRGDLEAPVFERGTDVRNGVEVLPVPLAEGVAVTGLRELDRGVADAGGRIHSAGDDEPVSGRLARDDGVGDGEVHHRVGVEIEDEPTRGPEAIGHRVHRQPQVAWREVVEAVERADHGVEAGVDRQLGKSHPT